MGRALASRILGVYLNGRTVGRLVRTPSGGLEFQYESSWLDWRYAHPVSLSLPLQRRAHRGAPVIAALDNLLPDADSVRRQLAERTDADGSDVFSLLAKLGRDCVGALQFLPPGEPAGPPGQIEGVSLDDHSIARMLRELPTSPLGVDREGTFRISLGGSQAKTALLFWRQAWHLPSGATPTTHIMKPQIGRFPDGVDLSQSVENEYLCMQLTKAFGLPAAQVEIAEFAGVRALVVQRFDRRWTNDGRLLRQVQEDCCQALAVPSAGKYEADGGPGIRQILGLLQGSDEPHADRRRLLKALVVFWLLGATDGHAKNFSILIGPGGRFRLAPVYDVMSAQPLYDAKQIRRNAMKFAMAVGNNRHYRLDIIRPRHFVQTAIRHGVPRNDIHQVFAEITDRADSALHDVLERLPPDFPEPVTESIVGGLRARLRLVAQADV